MSAALASLLRHLSVCRACEQGACASYSRLAKQLGSSGDQLLLHLTDDAIEAYCFNRLPESLMGWCRRHVNGCDPCRRRVQMNAASMIVIQNAFSLLKSNDPSQRMVRPFAGAVTFDRVFSPEDLLAARANLPVSRLVASRCLAILQREDADLSEVEAVVSEDPVIAAHLMKVANSALIASRRQIRSLSGAILHLGLARTRVHVWGLSAKSLFASPTLRTIWTHSVRTAKVARNLAIATGIVDRDEACFAGLVHDIGQLVLNALGPAYEDRFQRLRAKGLYPVRIERQLCGSSHAEIGADLLDSWSFPPELVEAVRQHHTPSACSLPLTSLLYIAESWEETPEDVFDTGEHRIAMGRLGITNRHLSRIANQCAPDLELLRMAA